MKSWIFNLCSQTVNISSESKYLLATFLNAKASEKDAQVTTDTAKGLGLSARLTARLMDELVVAGHLIRTSGPSTGSAGRPVSVWLINPEFLGDASTPAEMAAQGREGGGHFEAVIARLLSERMTARSSRLSPVGPGRPPSRQGAAGRLNPGNRLLLCFLFGVADACGIVRGWRPSDMAELVGMTKTSFHAQIEKLKVLGYLRAVVPGVSARQMFGVAPGAFFLDLQKLADQTNPMPGFTFRCVNLSPFDDHAGREAERLSELGHQSRPVIVLPRMAAPFEMIGVGDDDGRKLSIFFDGVGSPGLTRYLQLKLEEYASTLLSGYWAQVGGSAHRTNLLREVIKKDMWPLAQKDVFKQSTRPVPDPERARQLEDLVFGVSLLIAQSVRCALTQSKAMTAFEDFMYAILPTEEAFGEKSFRVVVSPKNRGEEKIGHRTFRLDAQLDSRAEVAIVVTGAHEGLGSFGSRYQERV